MKSFTVVYLSRKNERIHTHLEQGDATLMASISYDMTDDEAQALIERTELLQIGEAVAMRHDAPTSEFWESVTIVRIR